MTRSLSSKGFRFIVAYEGEKLNLYDDPAGHCTIGHGHLVHKGRCNGREPEEFRRGISRRRASQLFKQDVAAAEAGVNNAVSVPLTQNQFDALVSFTFNLGVGNLLRSTLLKVLNQGKFGDVPNQLNRWVNGGTPPRPMPGLVRRRREEGKLWTAGDVSGAGKGPPARTPGRPSADIYTVVSGDTLGTIARKFGVRVDEIVKANGIVDRNVIQVGQKIIIPKGKTAKRKTPKPKAARPKRGDGKRPAPRPRVYTVVSGDNLTKIARRFGTTVPAIVKANAIANPDLIRVGQRLTIR